MFIANLISVLSASSYILSYAVMTAYLGLGDHHRDLVPFYAAVTTAAAIHTIILVIHTWRRRKGLRERTARRTPSTRPAKIEIPPLPRPTDNR